jgi:hypothetical protein
MADRLHEEVTHKRWKCYLNAVTMTVFPEVKEEWLCVRALESITGRLKVIISVKSMLHFATAPLRIIISPKIAVLQKMFTR